MTESLSGHVAIVTGGARGLGLAMARALAAEGADLALVDRLDGVETSAASLAAEVPGRVIGVAGDVTHAADVQAMFARIAAELGTPTILVNAAGIAWNEAALTISPERFRSIIDVNVTGTFLTCQAFARLVVDAGRVATIVNVASMSGLVVNTPQPQAAYNASKAAVSMLTSSLAIEWLPLGIRVNAIAPGYFASDMTKEVAVSEPEMVGEWLRRTPAGRMGEPPELGPLVRYLCSDESAFVVGQSIVIDGGYTLL